MQPASSSSVDWLWTGGVTSSEAVTVAGTTAPEELALRVTSDFGMPVFAQGKETVQGVFRFHWTGLSPATTYEILLGEEHMGSFKTLPQPGEPASFRLALGACNQNPESSVFAAIAALKPEMMIITGDFHYSDIATNSVGMFVEALTANLRAPIQGAFWKQTPVVYMWDDHDFGPNNSDSTSPSKEAARKAYEQIVPHYPFADQGDGSGISQSFTWGRVHFVITDLRSERLSGERMMGAAQLEWFKGELLRAGREFPLVVWVSSVPWNGESPRRDAWSGHPEERREIANFIKDNGLAGRIVILAGDAHMCAIDDGENTDFADGGGAPIPIFHAGALERRGSYKGGPYNRGARPGSNQFGWMEVTDNGEEIQILWSSRSGRDPSGMEVIEALQDARGPIEYRFTPR